MFAPQVQWAIKLYSDKVLTVAHIVNGKAPKNPSILNPQTGKISMTSSNFTADNWITDTTAFVSIAQTILPANWQKIYAAAKAVNIKMWCSANAQIIDLSVDEDIDERAMIIDIPNSDDETALMAPVKDESMDISINAGHDGSKFGSGSGSGNDDNDEEEEEDEEAEEEDSM